jgi:salicylate hydroxylase
MDRTHETQEASLVNGTLWHFPDGPLQRVHDAAMNPRRGMNRSSIVRTSGVILPRKWCYAYDAEVGIDRGWVDKLQSSDS